MRIEKKPRAPKALSLINKKAVRQTALDMSQRHRDGKFTRCSEEFLTKIEAQLLNVIKLQVLALPSVGKTMK